MKQSRSAPRGFTLVEILIVVVILGILSGVVVPAFAGVSDEARQGAFVESMHGMIEGCEMYRATTGQNIVDASSGTWPAELDGFIEESDFERETPVGGVWDTEYNDSGVTSAVGVHFDGTGVTRDDAFMTEIDAILDDGDLTSGVFRRLGAGRYYYVLEE